LKNLFARQEQNPDELHIKSHHWMATFFPELFLSCGYEKNIYGHACNMMVMIKSFYSLLRVKHSLDG
jgi:hypothetical protein